MSIDSLYSSRCLGCRYFRRGCRKEDTHENRIGDDDDWRSRGLCEMDSRGGRELNGFAGNLSADISTSSRFPHAAARHN